MNKSINHIATFTGKSFDLLNPEPEMVCIEDIARSLAYQCRYTGHTRKFYSVAQHCALMAMNEDLPGDPMVKLLHDAAETYIGDIAKPWKNLLFVGNFGAPHLPAVPVKVFEAKIQDVIGLALGVALSHSAEVKESDIRMMATEVRDLMPVMPPGFVWGVDVSNPVEETIIPWLPDASEQIFLAVYQMLKLKRTGV
ncbi:hypothetical protein LCGC14_0574030 [marine sediment metagenome]|uniref:HD domain-containing protein n=1 Tax=marine sediment metagenome TaxID=412755 RepID=A0A0F9URJ5_9ZZZZ